MENIQKVEAGRTGASEPGGKKFFCLFLDGDNFRQYQGVSYRLVFDWMKSVASLSKWQVKIAVATTHSFACVKCLNNILDESNLPEVDIRIVRKGERNLADRRLIAMQKDTILLASMEGTSDAVYHVLASHDGDLIRKFSREVERRGYTGYVLNTMQWHPPGLKRTKLETLWKLDVRHVHRRKDSNAWELIPTPDWRWEQFMQEISREMIAKWFITHPRAGKLPHEAISSICKQIVQQFRLEKEVMMQMQSFIHETYGMSNVIRDGIPRKVWEKTEHQSKSGEQKQKQANNIESNSHTRLFTSPPQNFPDEQNMKLIRKQLIER